MPHKDLTNLYTTHVAEDACNALYSMKVMVSQDCKSLYYNDIYDIQAQHSLLQLNHTTSHTCFNTDRTQHETVKIITQHRKLSSQVLVPYNVHEVLMYAIYNDDRHILNVIRRKYVYSRTNITVQDFVNMLTMQMYANSSYAVHDVKLYAQVYVSNNCNTYCAMSRIHYTSADKLSYDAMMQLCDQRHISMSSRNGVQAVLPVTLIIMSTGIYIYFSNSKAALLIRERVSAAFCRIYGVMYSCIHYMYAMMPAIKR